MHYLPKLLLSDIANLIKNLMINSFSQREVVRWIHFGSVWISNWSQPSADLHETIILNFDKFFLKIKHIAEIWITWCWRWTQALQSDADYWLIKLDAQCLQCLSDIFHCWVPIPYFFDIQLFKNWINRLVSFICW